MESKITIEIELPVTYTATKGYPATHEDPGCPDEVCDIDYDINDLVQLANEALEDPEIPGILLDEANKQALEYELYKADYLYEQRKDSLIEDYFNKGK